MSEAGPWLNSLLSAAIAFAAIYFRGWRVVSAMLLGTAVTVAILIVVLVAGGASLGDRSVEAAIWTNGSFSLIAAAAGAALGFVARYSSTRS